MEFKFRAVDDRPPTFFPPPSNVSYFTEQALRASYSTTTEFRRNDLLRNPSDMREAIQREIEKERIREEIIVAEIARKRVLEAEVRRELMIERALGLGRADGFSLYGSPSITSSAMRFEPRLPLLNQPHSLSLEERISRSLEERLGRSLEERVAFQARREVGNFSLDASPFQRTLEAAQTPEVKPLTESNKEKFIFLAKPDTNLSGAKRKAVTPPAIGASEHPSIGPKKKPKEEWSCALCQVTATSERGLNEHLQGRKHKAREAGLRAQKTGKNSSTFPLPKKTGKRTKPAETTGTPSSEQGVKLAKESFEFNKTVEASVQKTQNVGDLEKKNDEPPLQKKQEAEDSKKKNGKVVVKKKQGAEDSKKKNGEVVLQKKQGAEDPKKKNGEVVVQKKQEAEDSKKKNGDVVVQKKQAAEDSKKNGEVVEEKVQKKVKKFKFWCEMCQIGAYSEVVMTNHRKGKKHLARVQELSQNAGTLLAPMILQSPEAAQKANDAGVVAKEAIEKRKENMAAVEGGSVSSSGLI